ncbi:hypothetical protein Tsubulata_035118, partial [Turnera subulata]
TSGFILRLCSITSRRPDLFLTVAVIGFVWVRRNTDHSSSSSLFFLFLIRPLPVLIGSWLSCAFGCGSVTIDTFDCGGCARALSRWVCVDGLDGAVVDVGVLLMTGCGFSTEALAVDDGWMLAGFVMLLATRSNGSGVTAHG